jgi:hypothetical protein
VCVLGGGSSANVVVMVVVWAGRQVEQEGGKGDLQVGVSASKSCGVFKGGGRKQGWGWGVGGEGY